MDDLLAAGASPSLMNDKGQTPVDLIIMAKRQQTRLDHSAQACLKLPRHGSFITETAFVGRWDSFRFRMYSYSADHSRTNLTTLRLLWSLVTKDGRARRYVSTRLDYVAV
jgi:hypothetical protein